MTRAEEIRTIIEILENNNGDPRQIKWLWKELRDLEYQEVKDEGVANSDSCSTSD